MKLADGVYLHLLKNTTFKTNHIRFRFSGQFNQKTVARRTLVAQMLATANADYPTIQQFRKKLSSLYGADLSTQISIKGLVHIVDIDISFVKDRFIPHSISLLEEIILFLQGVLFSPLVSVEQYQSRLFHVEQTNLVNLLRSDRDDSFYSSSLALKELFYDNDTLKLSKYSSPQMIETENSYTAFQEFQKMLIEDQLDIFILGEFDDYRMIQLLNRYPFEQRFPKLNYTYQQEYTNVISKKIDIKQVSQSVLQLGYHLPISYDDARLPVLLVYNGILGGFMHSKLFTEVREKYGLAYTIGSHFDIYTGLLTIYAGIDSYHRNKTMQLISKQLSDIKLGRFSFELIDQTKKLLKTTLIQSQDNPKAILEQVYNQHHLEGYHDFAKIIESLDKVNKVAIQRLASQIKLQAFYFLEESK